MPTLYFLSFVAFTPSATCEAAIGNITLFLEGTVAGSTPITGPVVVSVNLTVSILCRAKNTDRLGTLQGLNWQYSGNSNVTPVVGAGETSDRDVYVECVAGQSGADHTVDWVRVLHFKRILPSSFGIYACVANYGGLSRFQRVAIRVSGVWMCNS